MPRVATAWQEVYGKPATEADIDRLYKDFYSVPVKFYSKCSALIPGALETFENIKKRGAKLAVIRAMHP